MRAVFRDMDLYKGIILASLVLLPAAGWWAWSLDSRIRLGEQAIRAAETSVLQAIGSLQAEVEEVQRNKLPGGGIGTGTGDHRVFFANQIRGSSSSPLSSNDFRITPENDLRVPRLNAIDSEVTIEFKRSGKDDYALPRDYIMALLFNIESAQPQIWKLRHIKLRNEETQRLVSQKQAPPPEIGDMWLVDGLKYVRRSPDR